jgi:parallel beta-helix repeat protein
MSTLPCPSCGTPLSATTRFCGQCGSATSGALGRSVAAPWFIPATNALTPGTLLDNGRYQIHRLIKNGAMGAVYQAQDSRLADQDCAVKELIVPPQQTPQERTESEAWFTREARLLAGLRHAAIPRISNHFSEAGRRFMVMDFIEGQDLEKALAAQGGPFSLALVLEWACVLGEVLSYLHAQQPPIIFRDLKPANIMLTPQGRLMLVDFGIARTLRGTGTGGALGARTAIGTPGYAPPEQFQGLAEPRSDQYALAATLHHLLTNRDPQQEAPFTFPPVRQLAPGVPQHVEDALAKALSMAISDRYPSMGEFLAVLRSVPPVAKATPSSATGPGAAPRTSRMGSIIVAPDGSGDARTLGEALQRAAPGAVIRLVAGEHRLVAPLTLNQPVTLEGAGRDLTRVVSANDEYVLRCAGPGGVVLRDLTVAHEDSQSADVVEVTGGSLECTDCRFTGAVTDPQFHRGVGLWLHGASAGYVRRCEMTANGRHGILVSDQAQFTLEANICRQNTWSGISYSGTAGGTAQKNVCNENQACGIDVTGEAQPTLEANTCGQNTSCGISYRGSAGGTAR